MRIALSVVIVSLLAACSKPTPTVTTSAYAIVGTVPVSPVSVAQIDSLIRATVTDKHLVGLSVAVAQDGKVVLAKGYGLKTLGSRDSVSAETMFAVGSVTKQFTCSAVLLLAQDGKLTLQDPVAKYFPKLTRAGDITLLDLGNHVSGYRDFYPLDFVDREMQKPATADQIIDEYATRPLDFDPGTRWSYSNTNFLILGRVVEQAGGQPFGAFLAQRIFTPVGMAHTQFDPVDHTPAMATGYTTYALGPPFPAEPEGRGWAGSAGAIWSTPSDLVAWDMALIGGKVLSDDSYRTLTTPRRLKDGRSTGYGCGDGIVEEGPAVVFKHGGAVSGFVAENIVVPATRSAIVMMANTDFASLDSLEDHILDKLVPHIDVPTINGPSARDAARTFLVALQSGRVDRSTLGDDYSAFLTPALVHSATKSLGPISDVEIENTAERGGMEVAVIRFKTGKQSAGALMYRTPDGRIQEVLFAR
ncbi:MAG TPA: serine hydrolase domain-containing protein [Gemmatimonadaceae bacterium]|nr:serine hydrolase domain-containing protein [Gemmatimonadaceae bacterium]